MAQAPSKRAVAVRGMGQWVPGAGYGEPGSLYHDDGFCDAPYVPGTLACPACVTPEAVQALAPLAAVQAERIAWLEAGAIAKVDAHEAAMPAQQPARPGKANKYGGKCRRCGTWVEAGAGLLAGGPGNWQVACVTCPEPAAAAPAPTATAQVTPGMYWTPDGDVGKVQASKQGNLYLKVLVGEDFEYVGGGRHLVGLVRMTVEEAKAYGRRTGQCCVCGTELTVKASIEAGIGPICASKF